MQKNFIKILDLAQARFRSDVAGIFSDLLSGRSEISLNGVTIRYEDAHNGGGRLLAVSPDGKETALADMPVSDLIPLAETFARNAGKFAPVDFPAEVRRACSEYPEDLSGDDLADRIRKDRGLTMDEARTVVLAVEGKRARGKA